GSGTGGLLTWTFTATDAALSQLAKGQIVHETYTVTLDDQNGSAVTRFVTVTIGGTNEAPVIGGAQLTGSVTHDLQGHETGSETTSGTIAFTHVNLTDVHLVSAAFKGTDYPLAQLASLFPYTTLFRTGSGTGGLLTWTFTATDAALNQLAKGQIENGTYPVTLDDQNHCRMTRSASKNITGTDDAPVIGVAQLTGSVTEDLQGHETDSAPTPCTIAFPDAHLTDVDLVSAVFKYTDYALRELRSFPTRRSSDLTGSGSGGLLTWTFTATDAALNQLAKGQI